MPKDLSSLIPNRNTPSTGSTSKNVDSTVKEELPQVKNVWDQRDSTMSEDGLRGIWFTTYQTVLGYLVSQGLGTLVSVEQRANLESKLQHAADLADQAVISYVAHRITHRDVVLDSLEHYERMVKK